MTNATQPMKLAIGAESLIVPYLERDGMDEVQLITADGQHFALIQQSPTWENADLIVKAVEAHDALVAACEAMRDCGMFDLRWEGVIAYEEETALVMAALEAAK